MVSPPGLAPGWACRALPRPVPATGGHPGPHGATAHDLLVSHGAHGPPGPEDLGALGRVEGRGQIAWSSAPVVHEGHAEPRARTAKGPGVAGRLGLSPKSLSTT